MNRNDADKKYTWDLSSLFVDQDAFDEQLKKAAHCWKTFVPAKERSACQWKAI